MISDRRPCLAGGVDEHRLDPVLRDIEVVAGAVPAIVAMPGETGAPRRHSRELGTGEADREQSVAHLVPGGRDAGGGSLDAEVAEHFHRPLAGDVRAGSVGDPRGPGDHADPDAELRQRERSIVTPNGPAPTTSTSVSCGIAAPRVRDVRPAKAATDSRGSVSPMMKR